MIKTFCRANPIKYSRTVIGFSCALLFSQVASVNAIAPDAEWLSAELTSDQNVLIEQRYHYELAKSYLAKNKEEEEYRKHYARLGDYPLIPYLDYSELKQNLYDLDFKSVDRFLNTNKGTFLEYRLREQWLFALAKKRKWREFISYYTPNIKQKSLRCYHLEARLSTGDNSAYQEVPAIWTQGKSQPKACDPLFKKWRRQGGLTNEIAWLRFNNAMAKRKRGLANYVKGLMTGDYKKYAEEFMGVDAYPARIKQHKRFAEQSEPMQLIISHGIKRFARIDPKQALYHWERYEAQRLFDKEITTATKLKLVSRLTSKGHTAEAEALIKGSRALQQRKVVERMIRESLRHEDYEKALQWITKLDEDVQQSDRWLYWQARLQDELNLSDTKRASRDIYLQLSKTRGFYGFLSADLLNQDYSLEHKPSDVLPSTVHVIENLPAMKRAKELWFKGNFSEARAEWQFATKEMTPTELVAAGKTARKWGWYNKGIHAMIQSKYWDDLDIRFPLAYQDTVEKMSSKNDVALTFIYAIARQESAFYEKARSSAGAMGLMQLMPGTARQTAKKSGIKHHDSYLLDPEYNIQLGSQYLNELLNKYNGNRILAAAAYNAGPHRVNKWIKRSAQDIPFDIWIETIPFKETRGYVQNVLAFSVIYAYRLGEDGEFITEKESQGPL